MSASAKKPKLVVPERSKKNTVERFTWDEVRGILDKETMRRAEYIARILRALSNRFGDEVYSIASSTIYQIGLEKGEARASLVKSNHQSNNLESLATLVHHKIAELYLGNEVEIKGSTMVVREDYCPLLKKWKDMGMSDDEVARHCMMFDQVDKGMVEGFNHDYVAELSGCWNLAERGYCEMIVREKAKGGSRVSPPEGQKENK